MAENLRTTRYADGSPIPRIEDQAGWDALDVTSQAYCWYSDDSASHAATYGALYTWAAAMHGAASSEAVPSGIQGVCPSGWHLPSNNEFTILVNYLITNGYNYDGTGTGNKIGKAVADSVHWIPSPSEGTVATPAITEAEITEATPATSVTA